MTTFDWTEKVTQEFNTQSVPVIRRSCLSASGELNSFRLVMRGYDTESNIVSDSVGPSELGTCNNWYSPV